MIGIVVAVLVIAGLAVALFGPHRGGRARRGVRGDAAGGWAVPRDSPDRRDSRHDQGADGSGGADGGAGSDGGGGGSDGGGGGCGGGGCGGGGGGP